MHLQVLFCFECCAREVVSVRRSVQPRCHWVSPRSPQLWHRWRCYSRWRKKRNTSTFLLLLWCSIKKEWEPTALWWCFYFLTVSLTWECLAVKGVALRSLRHSSVAVGDNIYVYGGILEGNPTNDLLVFNTGPYIILIKEPYFWVLMFYLSNYKHWILFIPADHFPNPNQLLDWISFFCISTNIYL